MQWQVLRAWQTEPITAPCRQVLQRPNFLAPTKTRLQEPPGIEKALWCETEGRRTKKGVQDLRVDLDPLATRRVDVAARRMAHGRRGVAEQKKDHAAPGYYAEAVEYDKCLDNRHVLEPGYRSCQQLRRWMSLNRCLLEDWR